MENIVITSGKKYIDIDAYASIFAYKELLNNLGYNAYAVTTAKLNESVSNLIKELGFKFDKLPLENCKYIILDLSNPDFFDIFVKEIDIIEIIDHHTGYEEYWKTKNINSQIEFIGSICTIIYEKYLENGKENLLSQKLCMLLTAGILDNTLNLKSKITTSRDINAYENLMKFGQLDKNWASTYFNSCYCNIINNLENSIKNDIKIEKVSSLLPEVFGQLIVPRKNIIFDNMDLILQSFDDYTEWIFNIISLEDGKSYLLCSNEFVEKNISILFDKPIKNKYLILDNCMLRKEIMKLAIQKDNML